MSNSKLDDLRRDIDALDSELLKLFQQRAEKAAEIYKAKGKGSPWRPAREAEHLRELCNQVRSAGGALTEQRVRRIWRAIYADSVASQSRLTVYATKELEIAVREHFGNDIDFAQKQNTEEVLNAVNSAGSSAVAAITLEDWQALLKVEPKELFVHECLYDRDEQAFGLLIAKRLPESSELDYTLVGAQAEDESVIQSEMNELFRWAGFVDKQTGERSLEVWPGKRGTAWVLLRVPQRVTFKNLKKLESKKYGKIIFHYLGVIPCRKEDVKTGDLENE